MALRGPSLLARLPDQLQVPLLTSGTAIAAYGAWELDKHYPVEFQMEPFVGMPTVAWSIFWLGVGLVTVGVGISALPVPGPVTLFSESQRSGLVATGIVFTLPFPPVWLGRAEGLVIMLLAVFVGISGWTTVIVWRLIELFIALLKHATDSVFR